MYIRVQQLYDLYAHVGLHVYVHVDIHLHVDK